MTAKRSPKKALSWLCSPLTKKAGQIISGPELVTRGWVYAPDSTKLLEEGAAVVKAKLDQLSADEVRDLEVVRRVAKRSAGGFVADRTQRKPMIVPVLMEI